MPKTGQEVLADAAGFDGVQVEFGDTHALDAFGRLRVSNPVTLFDAQLQYDKSPLLFFESITNTSGNATSTHLVNESSVNMYAENGDIIIRQSRPYIRYQPGKSQEIALTFLASKQNNSIKRVGYFDADNGVFLEINGQEVYLVLRSKISGTVVDTKVLQSNWNKDTLDGSGASGITLDLSKAQILKIDLQWLGVGRVRVAFNINGPVAAHEFRNANEQTGVYMTTANLPIRYEIRHTGAGNSSLKQICSTVRSEGGFVEETGRPFSAGNSSTIAVTTLRPILSIRPRALFNSIVNRGDIMPKEVYLYTATQPIKWVLYYGGALTNASFANVNTTYSITEVDVAATAITGGIPIASGHVPASQTSRGISGADIASKISLALDITGGHPVTPFSDVLTVAALSLNTSTNVAASLNWLELR